MKKLTIIIFGTLAFGLVNLVFHFLTDYYLGLYIGRQHGVDLSVDPFSNSHLVIWNSFYSGPRTQFLFPQFVLVIATAGYFTTMTIQGILKKEKIKPTFVAIVILTWFIKIPVTVENSNFIGIYSGLLAW